MFDTTLHILGLGLDYSETDLWWWLNRRARLYRRLQEEHKIEPNKVYFYGNLNPDKAHILTNFGVIYEHIPVERNNYREQYRKIFDLLEERITVRK